MSVHCTVPVRSYCTYLQYVQMLYNQSVLLYYFNQFNNNITSIIMENLHLSYLLIKICIFKLHALKKVKIVN